MTDETDIGTVLTITDKGNTYDVTIGGKVHVVPKDSENRYYRIVQNLVDGGFPLTPEHVPTNAELDALADQHTNTMFEADNAMKALGLVLADVIAQAFGITKAQARQEVKQRWRDYYRGLL